MAASQGKKMSAVVQDNAGNEVYEEREAVAVFDSEAALNKAVDALQALGLSYEDMSLLADAGTLSGKSVKELEDADDVPHAAYVSPGVRSEGLAAAAGGPALAAGLGAAVLTIVVGGVHPGTKGTAESLKIVTDRVAGLALYAADRQVKLALEPLNPVYAGNRSCLTTVRDALDICEAVDWPNLGIAVDVYHVWWDTNLAAELRRAGRERIFGYHLCDWRAETRDILLDRGMMGDGVADLKAIRAGVEGAGYDGPCEVEIFSAQDWWKRDPALVLDVMVDRFKTLC